MKKVLITSLCISIYLISSPLHVSANNGFSADSASTAVLQLGDNDSSSVKKHPYKNSKIHTTSKDKSVFTYTPERGYFQKAYTDPSDPRFMMSNEDETFSFGIGGIIHFTAFEDFAGSVNDYGFLTYNIPVPTNYTPQFGMSVSGSRLFFKGRAKVGGHPLVGVLEVKTSLTGNSAGIRQAYASYGVLTLGRTYTFFMDLEAGPMTVDLQGPNTQLNIMHPLMGVTLPINHWSFAAAAELSEFSFTNTSYYNKYGITDSYQSFPDFTAHIKYKNDFGHLQVAGILRNLYYSTYEKPETPSLVSASSYDVNLQSHSSIGYGVSLSGKINLGSRTFFTFQGTYGRGISRYYNDLQDASLNLVRKGLTGSDTSAMTCLYSYGGYLAFQHDWSEKLCSSIMYGIMGVPNNNEAYKYDYDQIYRNSSSYMSAFRSSQYVAVNLIWNYSKYGSMGIEYTHGFRHNYTTSICDNESTWGQAGRLALMFMYAF